MKIEVKEGTAVRLDRVRYTSVNGGVYDLAKLGVPESEWDRIRKTTGVSEVKPPKPKTKGDN